MAVQGEAPDMSKLKPMAEFPAPAEWVIRLALHVRKMCEIDGAPPESIEILGWEGCRIRLGDYIVHARGAVNGEAAYGYATVTAETVAKAVAAHG